MSLCYSIEFLMSTFRLFPVVSLKKSLSKLWGFTAVSPLFEAINYHFIEKMLFCAFGMIFGRHFYIKVYNVRTVFRFGYCIMARDRYAKIHTVFIVWEWNKILCSVFSCKIQVYSLTSIASWCPMSSCLTNVQVTLWWGGYDDTNICWRFLHVYWWFIYVYWCFISPFYFTAW